MLNHSQNEQESQHPKPEMYVKLNEDDIVDVITNYKTKKCQDTNCVYYKKMNGTNQKVKTFFQNMKCFNYHNKTDKRRKVIKKPSENQEQNEISQNLHEISQNISHPLNDSSLNGESTDQSSMFMQSDKTESEIYQNLQQQNFQTFKLQENKLAYDKDPCPNKHKCQHFQKQLEELEKTPENEGEEEDEEPGIDQDKICVFSHNDLEYFFHPNLYKTIVCEKVEENKKCKYRCCPFFHEVEEKRKVDDFLFDVQKWRTIKPDNVYMSQMPGQVFSNQSLDMSSTSNNLNTSGMSNNSKMHISAMSQFNGKAKVHDSKE